jgi:hypothetical protein
MRKIETIDDIYFLDAELSDPVIRQSYIANAETDAEDFEVIEDEDGGRGVFLRTTSGLYPVGAAQPKVVLASATGETMSDAPPVAAGTVRPGAMQGEMRAIEQTPIQKIMEATGLKLEEVGKAIESIGSINIGGVEISLRDLLPLVGYSEDVTDPLTGQTSQAQRGTPQALQMAGRGESLTTGKGFTTQMKPDVKDAVLDVGFTASPLVKPAAKAVKKAAGAVKETLATPPRGSVQLAPNLEVEIAPAERTKNFKNWFGDSKVVDEKGNPLIVYHGTGADFDEFKKKFAKQGRIGRGFYFATDPTQASNYAFNSRQKGGSPTVVPVYLKASNILNTPSYDKSKPIDGIKYGGMYLVYDPTQIKSATGNIGTFDPKDPRITRGAIGAPVAPAAMQDEENK